MNKKELNKLNKKQLIELLIKKDYKIFEGTVKFCIKQMLEEGYRPLNLKETYDWRIKNEETRWFNVGTIYIEGEIRDMTKEDMENIEEIYKNNGRGLCLYGPYYGLYGDVDLGGGGRFVGVKRE